MLRYFWRSDDEQLAGQWHDSHFDEDAGWWVSVQQAGATFALAAALTIASSTTAAAQGVFSQSQDDPAGSLTNQVTVQEEYWQNPVAPYNWPQPTVLTDDDVHPTFVQTFTPDDGDYWHQLVAPVADSNYLRLPFLDPDEIPVGSFSAVPNPIDDSAVWAPNNPPWDPNWTLLFFLDDGSTVPPFQADEDFWPTQAQPVPYNWPQPAQPIAVNDEAILEFVAEDVVWLQLTIPDPGSLVWPQPFVFEQNETPVLTSFATEEYWLPLTPPVPDSLWLLRQDNFEQSDATGSLVSQYDEEAWLNPTRPVADSLYQGLPYWFDEAQPSLFVPFAYEEYWQNPTAPVPDSLWILRQDAFDAQEPSGNLFLDLDEGLWTPQIPAVPASLLWLQPFGFEQHDASGSLRTNLDEDFWFNPVAPVNWPQPAVITQDDIIGRTPNTGQDEDFWSFFAEPFVAPMPPSLVLQFPYSPDPEEIPAGSLHPFIPPPPISCPPPKGPDGDTTYSYFGGNNPTKVLLCRICNSGNPLLVRGDYAIWCPDCCAFVSKQDTVMGTVRAPGQLKGVF